MSASDLSAKQSSCQAKNDSYVTKDFVFTCLAGFFHSMSNNIVNPAIPLYVTSLGGSPAEVGIIMAIRTYTALVARPIAGMLADKGYLIGMLSFSGLNGMLGGVAYGFVNNLWQISGVQVFKGLGLTANSTASGTVVAELAPQRRRGEALGIYGIIAPIAMAVGPALGMVLLNRAGFTSLFALSALLGLLAFGVAVNIRLPKKDRPAHVPLKLLNKEALLPSLVMAFVYVSTSPVYIFVPLYFTNNDLGDPSLFFTGYAVSMMIIRAVTGRLSDIYGRAAVFVPGALAMALASFYLANDPGYWGAVTAAVALGSGFGAAQPALMALAIDRANAAERGSATATVYTFVDLGYSTATLADGYIVQSAGFAAMFGTNAVVTLLGVLGYFLVKFLGRRRHAQAASG